MWVFFFFDLIFRQDLANVHQQTIYHVKEQLISFHMMYELLQDFFLNHLKFAILWDQSWKKLLFSY